MLFSEYWPGAGDCDHQRTGDVEDGELGPISRREKATAPMHGKNNNEQVTDDERWANWAQEAQGEQESAKELGESGQYRETARVESDALKEIPGPLDAATSEPSEQLLGTMGSDSETDN